jgi:hypothetical protein
MLLLFLPTHANHHYHPTGDPTLGYQSRQDFPTVNAIEGKFFAVDLPDLNPF